MSEYACETLRPRAAGHRAAGGRARSSTWWSARGCCRTSTTRPASARSPTWRRCAGGSSTWRPSRRATCARWSTGTKTDVTRPRRVRRRSTGASSARHFERLGCGLHHVRGGDKVFYDLERALSVRLGDAVPVRRLGPVPAAVRLPGGARGVLLAGGARRAARRGDAGAAQGGRGGGRRRATRAVDELDAFHREAVGALKDGAKDSTPAARARLRAPAVAIWRSASSTRRAGRPSRRATATRRRRGPSAIAAGPRRATRSRSCSSRCACRCRRRRSRCSSTTGRTTSRRSSRTRGTCVAALHAVGRRRSTSGAGRGSVGDFAQDVTLPVGVKRSLFKRTVAPETIALDEYVIGGFELRDDRCELRLRKRAEAPDSLVFTLTPRRGQADGGGAPPGRREAESGLPAVLDASSAVEVERLWQLLRNGVRAGARAQEADGAPHARGRRRRRERPGHAGRRARRRRPSRRRWRRSRAAARTRTSCR